jgi:antitoxin ParD1/3/4
MGTKNISLPKDLEEYIDAKVASGEYAHASEVVRDGLRLMMQQEAEKLEWLRAAIAEGVASADQGELYDSEAMLAQVKARGRRFLEARKRAR